jgi:hypothetical protein
LIIKWLLYDRRLKPVITHMGDYRANPYKIIGNKKFAC